MAGAGMTTASSAASDGATTKAAIASAPMAAAQSDRRLNWLRDMRFPLGLSGGARRMAGQSRAAGGRSQSAALPDAQDTQQEGRCYRAPDTSS